RARRLAAVVPGLYVGAKPGETGPGGAPAADAPPEHPPTRRRLPLGEGVEPPGVPARRFPDQGGDQTGVDPYPPEADPTRAVAVVRRGHPAVPLESGPVARRLPHAGDGRPGRVPPPDQEAEEGAGVLEDPDLPLRHRDRPAPLADGEDPRDLQGSLGGGELLQGVEPVL